MGTKNNNNNKKKSNKGEGSKFVVKKSVDISEEQSKFLEDEAIGFTKFVRMSIDCVKEAKKNQKSVKEILEETHKLNEDESDKSDS